VTPTTRGLTPTQVHTLISVNDHTNLIALLVAAALIAVAAAAIIVTERVHRRG
jgi:hypothetical protein